jgi:hypothetical protein
MFRECTSLTVAPELPATTLAKDCYDYMFEDCRSLNYVKVEFTHWNLTETFTSNWLHNVSPSGTFVCPTGLNINIRGDDYIPEGWDVKPIESNV